MEKKKTVIPLSKKPNRCVFREPELEKAWRNVIESKAAEEIKKDW